VAAAYTAYFDTLAATYAHAETREPVAVGAGAEQRTERRTGAAALATGAAVSSDDVVSRLRQQQAAEQRAPVRASARRAARSASSATPRGRSALDGVITLVITLMALTALALIAYAALTLNGVNVLPFLH
jgi:hypothetical protein